MLKFNLVDKFGDVAINKIAFYTPTDLGYSAGDTVDINFTSQYSLSQSLLENNVVSASLQHYLLFDISGSDLPQVGGQYIVDIVAPIVWNTYDVDWNDSDVTWNEAVNTIDTERGFIIDLIPVTDHTSSFENANYVTHDFDYKRKSFVSDFEEANYITASLNISGATPYISVREDATYIIYNG
tara:strand:- start:3271 stop:3819 length:549 start_codon:yes stop_codon:yes gene_type:complete